MIGEIVGSYRIVSRLGVGGMGAVYRAEHQLIGRTAAVKLLLPELTTNRDVVQRFFNEARATTTIKHPGIVEVFDFGYLPSGHAFIVMELLEGEPLTQRMRARGRMPEGEACALMRDICSALAAAHDKGIVHRDLKPDNIFIVPDLEHGERTKILDFGIAKLTDLGPAGSATKTGAVMGTPTYMSPEQCRGSGEVDHRADLYSIGCMLYELVAGRPPFVRDGAGELIGSHLFVDPEPPSRHVAVSPPLDALIMTLLAKRPEQRVQNARELGNQLLHIAQGHGYASDVRLSGVHLAGGPPSHASLPAHRTPAHFTPMHHTPAPGAHHTPAHHTPAAPAHHTPAPGAHHTPAPGAHHTPAPGAHHTPAHFTPAHFTPPPSGQHRPAPHPPSYPPGAPTVAAGTHGQPTTLSGAASQTLPPARPSRRRLGIVLACAALAAAAGVAIVVATSSAKPAGPRDRATAPVAAPTPPPPTPAKASGSKPGDTRAAGTQPADTAKPTDAKPADATPADAKPADAGAVDLQPADTKPADTKPADTKPADTSNAEPADTSDTKPADTKPADTKPADTKPADAKPADAKPADTTQPMPTKPSKPRPPKSKPKPDRNPSGDLLETEL